MSVSVRQLLSACLLALAPQLAAPRCLSPSITTAGPSGLVVDTLAASVVASFSQHCTATACPSASLPCPAWLCWIAPAAPENPLSHQRNPTGTPAPSQSVSQSVKSLPVARQLSVCLLLDQAATSAPPPRQSHQLAQALISPTCRRLFCSLAAAACDLLDLAASATVSAPSPCDAAANNNATASDQPFACGRPIHLATSSPNKRADYCSSLA